MELLTHRSAVSILRCGASNGGVVSAASDNRTKAQAFATEHLSVALYALLVLAQGVKVRTGQGTVYTRAPDRQAAETLIELALADGSADAHAVVAKLIRFAEGDI
jgi:hypothetical protein